LRQTPGALEPFSVEKRRLWSFVDDHKYAIEEAALEAGSEALAQAASLQTRIAFIMMLLLCVYFLWRGVAAPLKRRGSPIFWILAALVIFSLFVPTLAQRLTPQRLDLIATIGIGIKQARGQGGDVAELAPRVFLVARAALAAAAACFLALCCHDAGYVAKQALLAFGLRKRDTGSDAGDSFAFEGVATGPEERVEPRLDDFQRRSGASPSGGNADVRRPETGAYATPRMRACAMLGVPLNASRGDIERAYREKMKRAHPDHGGSHARAAALNQARDLLVPHG
jgi:hypothetical protein